MFRSLTISTVAVLLALPAAAQTAAQADALIAAIASAGCEVREDNNAAILTASGLSENDAAAVVAALLGDGRATLEGGNLRLKTAGCE
jgi:hypothetical protein